METIDYKKFSKNIERFEFKNFYPLSKNHFNEPNKKTEFNIDFGDNFCKTNFEFYISGSLKKSDGAAYGADENIKLIDNFIPFLFSHIEVRKHNKLIEEIEYPGQLSTIKGTLCYSKSEAKSLTAGFESDFKAGKFETIGNLSHFGLGFFENVVPIYKGGFCISFVRAEDDDAIFRWKSKKTDGTLDNATLPEKGQILIEEFFIRVPIIEYKTTSKIELIDDIKKKQKILFHFYNWQCIQQARVSGTTYSFDITNIYRNIYNPKYIIVSFQTDRQNNQVRDPSKFDSLNVKNYRIKLNGSYYPNELQNLHTSEGVYRLMYQSYQEFRKVFYRSLEMYYKPEEFKDNRPLYVIDTTKSALNISGSKNEILINIDFQNAVSNTSNVVCYIAVVSDKQLLYDVLKNDITEVK